MKIIDETRDTPDSNVLEVDRAEYVDGYRLRLTFSNGKVRTVDFLPFLSKSPHPLSKKYLKKKFFKRFQVVSGDLTWNDDEMIFPVDDLYRGAIHYTPPRQTEELQQFLKHTNSNGVGSSRFPNDLDRYMEDRKHRDPEFAKSYIEGFQAFQFGALLKLAREQSGMTQEQVAKKLRTNKSAISRIENHAEDIRLSTLRRYAKVLGKRVTLDIS